MTWKIIQVENVPQTLRNKEYPQFTDYKFECMIIKSIILIMLFWSSKLGLRIFVGGEFCMPENVAVHLKRLKIESNLKQISFNNCTVTFKFEQWYSILTKWDYNNHWDLLVLSMWQAWVNTIHTHLICAHHTCELSIIMSSILKMRLTTIVYKYYSNATIILLIVFAKIENYLDQR